MVIGTLIGGMILASANNMLTVYVGVETLSILSYALASFRKNNELSSEAGLKYSLFGGVSAALMLFGLSHLYGIFGTIQFTGIVEKLSQLTTTEIYFVLPSMLLVFAGLGYKIACVPFHMWSPDVYEGSPLPVTTFFSIVPKLAGISVILRVTHIFFNDTSLLSTTWLRSYCCYFSTHNDCRKCCCYWTTVCKKNACLLLYFTWRVHVHGCCSCRTCWG